MCPDSIESHGGFGYGIHHHPPQAVAGCQVLLEIGHAWFVVCLRQSVPPSGDDGKADQRRLDGKAASNHEEDASHNSARHISLLQSVSVKSARY
jgi:hypothetical protein